MVKSFSQAMRTSLKPYSKPLGYFRDESLDKQRERREKEKREQARINKQEIAAGRY